MFGFTSMAFDRESRAIENTVINDATIDTCRVTDSEQPFETGIQHNSYGNGQWIIVEMYDTKEEAQAGHKKWVALFEKGLPQTLTDVSTCEIKQIASALGVPLEEHFIKK